MARDVLSETLEQLERKLRELERELGAPSPAPPPTPAAPSGPPSGAGLDDLARQVDDLGRFRDQLARIGRELDEEYARVVARLRSGAPEEPPPAPAPPEPAPPPPEAPAEAPVTPPGALLVDAGPFADLSALGSFEAAVAAVPGVDAVEITGFEGRRALVSVELAAPVALETELRRALPQHVVRAVSAAGRLTVDLETA
jgi:hypothetical protein